jgi:hypothetical protein
VIVAHIMGIPVEESLPQLVPAGAAIATAVGVAVRIWLGHLRRRFRVRTTRGSLR